jgi:polyprenyl P-hydroxybenzoate/phenylacrylic acid decarboxylase-like protein
MRKRYLVGITGASGSIYGARLVEALLADPEREVHLIVSPAGARVMRDELERPERNAICGMRNAESTNEDEGRMVAQPAPSGPPTPFDPRSFLNLTPEQSDRLIVHDDDDIGAAPASGTFRCEAMVICPCSMKTLGRVAAGLADSLLARAADVTLKEGRPLLVMARETPLSLIHLRNMTRLAEAGAVILPAMPAFYHHPQTIEDLVRHLIHKILARLGLDLPGMFQWKGDR